MGPWCALRAALGHREQPEPCPHGRGHCPSHGHGTGVALLAQLGLQQHLPWHGSFPAHNFPSTVSRVLEDCIKHWESVPGNDGRHEEFKYFPEFSVLAHILSSLAPSSPVLSPLSPFPASPKLELPIPGSCRSTELLSHSLPAAPAPASNNR